MAVLSVILLLNVSKMDHLNCSLAQQKGQMLNQLSSILSILCTSFSQKRQKEPHCVAVIRPQGICEIQLIQTLKGGCCHCRVIIQQSYTWYEQCQWSLWHAMILPWGILPRRIFLWRQVLVTLLLMPDINRKQTIKTLLEKG